MYANAQRKSPLRATMAASNPAGTPAPFAEGNHHTVYDRRDPHRALAAGLVTSYTMGGFIHILLVVAIIAVLLRVINGRTPL